MARTLYDNDDRFVTEYWQRFSDRDADEWRYFSGDTARIDDDGYITVLGRVDDVISVSGHRLGTMEVERAIADVDGVAEAAVVGRSSETGDTEIYAYVSTESGYESDAGIRRAIRDNIEATIGPIARPAAIVFTPELPKTRSGKIMRRLLENVANGEELGDTSALRNPEIVGEIQAEIRTEGERDGPPR
jgi:acetyl-CoA synthetase